MTYRRCFQVQKGDSRMKSDRRRSMRHKKQQRKQLLYWSVMFLLALFVVAGSFYCAVAEKALQEKSEIEEKKRKDETKKKAKEEKSVNETEEEKRIRSESMTGQEDPNAKVVYLTFDDGPSELTPKVLEILKQYEAKATFFITGYQPESRKWIKEAYDAGHTIGLHTFSHNYTSIYTSTDIYFQDLEAVGQVAKDWIGYVPSIIRFPGGTSNTVSAYSCTGIMSELVNMVHERGYEYYDWNCSSGDGAVATADTIYQQAIAGNGSQQVIILCHDAATKQTTVDALPKIIEFYKAQGYEFRAIKRGGFAAQHMPNN